MQKAIRYVLVLMHCEVALIILTVECSVSMIVGSIDAHLLGRSQCFPVEVFCSTMVYQIVSKDESSLKCDGCLACFALPSVSAVLIEKLCKPPKTPPAYKLCCLAFLGKK